MRLRDVGLLEYDQSRATPGFTLFSPLQAEDVYLLGMRGEVLHQWKLTGKKGGYAHLIPNGNLLGVVMADSEAVRTREALRMVREYDWDGNVVWECEAPGHHHDYRRLANGNTIFFGFERFTEESIGRLRGGVPGSEMEDGGVLGDTIFEVSATGDIVWEWHAQDDMEIENYPIHVLGNREEFSHANSLFPMANGDVLISLRRSNWLLVIDRDTKKVKWQRQDDAWGGQHDAQILDNGNLMLFANGYHVSDNLCGSKIIEMNMDTGEEVWAYEGSPPWSFSSPHISGCQRLWSGNTLICEGLWGRIFEVTPDGDIDWEYISPYISPQRGQKSAGLGNWVFRAYRYAPDSPEIAGRVKLN